MFFFVQIVFIIVLKFFSISIMFFYCIILNLYLYSILYISAL